jgi:TonB family protein
MVGLMLGTFLKSGNVQPNRSVVPQPSGSISESRYFRPSEVDQKARTLFRAEPQYTYEARENAVTGTVVLRAVFSASGEVTNIRVVSGLPDGLTERAVEAARGIKFTPAIKDGRAVSQYIQIEYNFNLY